LFAQIKSRTDWPNSICCNFDFIKKQKIDTVIVYYSYLGPWSSLPDSCKGISSVWVLWIKNNGYFAKQLSCDSLNPNEILKISAKPFNYFFTHRKDFELRKKYFKRNKYLPPISTDNLEEYIIFMTKYEQVILQLSDNQRTDESWKILPWISATVEMIGLLKEELNIIGE
jgi:hypothetical protein